ncbi:MAG: HNH endonuclease [Promethearchaeota archaeon]
MIKNKYDDSMDEFELSSILPKFIINSEGEKEPFDLERIAKGLIIDVGLNNKQTEIVMEAVARKIIGLLSYKYESISTYAVKDFICEELSKRGMDKFRSIYERTEDKKKSKFNLPQSFIDKYSGKQPQWGPLGYITYKRTYARIVEDENRTEEFFETIRRVVEGCFSLQKEHCIKLGLPWNEEKGLKSAKRMYEKIWNFKFTPPGRGLWTMGTPFIDKHGSMALNNCGFVSTKDIDIKKSMAFKWCMDGLMLGVGVGFDTKGAGKITIKKPKESNSVFKIPDSREGWVKALGKVLDGFFLGNNIPQFDYSIIRPAGELIKGFGGVASGPKPLKEMLNDIKELLYEKINEPIKSTDIVDIFNLIGKCVVAGNVRRSAQIALGSMDDKDFITMKQDSEKLKHHRWASNNSVIASVGMDYSPIVESIAKNGEPGVIWLENAQKYSRIEGEPDYIDSNVAGVNPCVTGNTLIAVADGRTAVPINQLAEEETDVPVYCKDNNGTTQIRMMRNPRITGYKKEIYEVSLDDGSVIHCTGEHKFILRNMKKKEAKLLKPGDRLIIMSKWQTTWSEIMNIEKEKKSKYWMLNTGKHNIFEHTFIYKQLSNKNIPKGHVIHHIDNNGLNNSINNLKEMTKIKHDSLHDISGDNNPMRKWWNSASDDEKSRYKKNMSESVSGENNPNYSGFTDEDIYNEMVHYINKYKIPLTSTAWKKYSRKFGMPHTSPRWGSTQTPIHLIKKANEESGFKYYDKSALMREYKRYIIRKKKTDLKLIFDKCTYVEKKCEICNKTFFVKWGRREQAYCSHSCSNKASAIEAGKTTKKLAEERHKKIKQKILDLFDKYVEDLNKIPNKSEFLEILNENGISDLRTAGLPDSYQQLLNFITIRYQCEEISSRKLGKNAYKEAMAHQLKENGLCYNHKVISVKKIGVENVYNGTVDEFHNFGIVLKEKKTKSNRPKIEIAFTSNCGEQSLESYELCCLVETFPSKHDNYEEFEETLKYAYLYAKSVTLSNTHWPVTNAVMLKNRRIGTSQSGIIDAFVKHGRRTILNWCDKGYNYLKKLDDIYSNWLCIPKSIKITSVKPSGTVSLLAGVSSGIHYPHSEYYIRRIRIARNSDLIPIIKEAGYPVKMDVYNPDYQFAVEFPIHETFYERSKFDVGIWEQFENAAAYQRHWSDNQVSITVTFTKEEVKEIKRCLECFEDKLKGVSMLPIMDHGFEQAPYEKISKEKYEEMVKNLKPLNLQSLTTQGVGEEGCTTDACLIKQEIADIKDFIKEKNGKENSVINIEKGQDNLKNIDLFTDKEDKEGN